MNRLVKVALVVVLCWCAGVAAVMLLSRAGQAPHDPPCLPWEQAQWLPNGGVVFDGGTSGTFRICAVVQGGATRCLPLSDVRAVLALHGAAFAQERGR